MEKCGMHVGRATIYNEVKRKASQSIMLEDAIGFLILFLSSYS